MGDQDIWSVHVFGRLLDNLEELAQMKAQFPVVGDFGCTKWLEIEPSINPDMKFSLYLCKVC